MNNIRIIFLLIIMTLLFFQCDGKDVQEKVAKKIIIKNNSKKELIKTLEKVIHQKNEKILLKIYTPESRKTINYNNKIGIGSAGTIDDFFYLEISRLNKSKKSKKESIKIFKIKRNDVFVELPSKKKLRIRTKKIKGKYFIDVLESPGGKILLLKEK